MIPNILNAIEITEENYDEIKNYVAELERAMECENIKMEEGDYDYE